ncbi:MAG: histidine kinase [Taibaiella sp.]|jgi:sensor histidine kinase YesM
MKKYNIITGLALSLFISLLIFFPRPFRVGYVPSGENAIVSFAYSFFCWLFIQLVIQKKSIKKAWHKAIICLSGGMLLSVAVYYGSSYFTDRLLIHSVTNMPERRKVVIMIIRGLLVSGFQFFITYLLYISGEANRMKQESERIKKENLEAKLYALQQQISPHFLFNALNTLRSIATDKTTKDYVLQLSNVFRYLLNNNQTNLATLGHELEFTRSYIHILKERFEDAMVINVDVQDRFLNAKLPPVSLQILIENAIKHNIISVEEPLAITISIDEHKSMLVIRNNFQPKISVEESTGTGLRNIRERYLLLSGQDIDVAKDNFFYTVKIPLISA